MTSVMFAQWISFMLLFLETNSLGIRGEHQCTPEKEVELTMADDMLGPSNLAELQTLFSSCVDGGCKIETTVYSTYDFSGDYCNYQPNVCQHNGTCLNNDTKPFYTCNCTDGYYGRNCSQKYCEHHPNACQHNGTCLNNDTKPYHTCDCTDRYYGRNCSQKYCEHHPNACQHNGTCLNNDTKPYHTCDCSDGYYGKNCSKNYCEHHPNPCQHNGTCLENVTHPYYTCNCTDGYYGKNCRQNYCKHHPNPCQHNGTCLHNETQPYYTCNCTDGYYGKNCSQNYCEHHPNPCQQNGTCLNNATHPYYTCNCTDGYYGRNCSHRFCENHQIPCQHGGTCLNNDTRPYFTCNCTDGYYGTNCSLNYCEHHPNTCQYNEECVDTYTNYGCECIDGCYGCNCEQTYCQHHPNTCKNGGTCLDMYDGTQPHYKCTCVTGYHGYNCDQLCDLYGGCYWINLRNINFAEATRICERNNKELAAISTTGLYKNIVHDVCLNEINTMQYRPYIDIWTASTHETDDSNYCLYSKCYSNDFPNDHRYIFLNHCVHTRYETASQEWTCNGSNCTEKSSTSTKNGVLCWTPQVCYVGLSNGTIKPLQISTTSVHHSCPIAHAVLNALGAWCTAENTENQWIQVDYLAPRIITGIVTQGRGNYPQWVKSYKVSYGNSTWHMHYYQELERDKIFSANYDQNTIVDNELSPPINARYVRIHPVNYHWHMSMRIEMRDC